MAKTSWRKILYYTHIWVGLVTTAFFLLYLVSGVFLNHRGFFHRMEIRENSNIVLEAQERAASRRFMAATKQLAAAMEPYTKRPDFDNLYVNPDGEARFLDRSGGKVDFHVQLSGETGAFVQVYDKQPWRFLNNNLHRAREMMPAWTALSTTLCVLIFVVLLCGLLILRWKRLEVILLLAGVAVLLIGMVIAKLPRESAAITLPSSPTLGQSS